MLAGLGLLFAQASSTAPPRAIATRVPDPPSIDGRLDDAAWARALPITTLTQKFPDEGEAASERTTIRVVYDDRAIYVAFDCEQTRSPVVRRLTRRDRQESDRVAIDLGTRHDGKSATFAPRLTLQVYGQLFLASAHYSDFSSFQSSPAAPRPVVHLSDLRPYAGPLAQNPDFQEGALNANARVDAVLRLHAVPGAQRGPPAGRRRDARSVVGEPGSVGRCVPRQADVLVGRRVASSEASPATSPDPPIPRVPSPGPAIARTHVAAVGSSLRPPSPSPGSRGPTPRAPGGRRPRRNRG